MQGFTNINIIRAGLLNWESHMSDIYKTLFGFFVFISEEQLLEAAQMKFLRHLLGITKVDKEKNQCIREKTGAENTVKEIKQYQENWLQHIQRMDTNRIPKQALQYKPKGRRHTRRPRKKWRDQFNPLNTELNPICYLLALLGAHHFLHVSRIRVKFLTFRLLKSYIYIYIYIYMEHPFLMFLDHTQRRSTVGRTPLEE